MRNTIYRLASYIIYRQNTIRRHGIIYWSGLDEQLVEAVVIYAESLQNGDENGIEENICTEQLSYQFNLTNSFMINLIFNGKYLCMSGYVLNIY